MRTLPAALLAAAAALTLSSCNELAKPSCSDPQVPAVLAQILDQKIFQPANTSSKEMGEFKLHTQRTLGSREGSNRVECAAQLTLVVAAENEEWVWKVHQNLEGALITARMQSAIAEASSAKNGAAEQAILVELVAKSTMLEPDVIEWPVGYAVSHTDDGQLYVEILEFAGE